MVAGEGKHQNDASGAGTKQIVLQHRGIALTGGGADGGKVGGLGYQLCHTFHQFIHLIHLFLNGIVDGFGFIHAEAVVHHQFIHIHPVTGSGGNPPGAGVGLFQVAHSGEVSHFVANGGGGIVHVGKLCDCLGANGLGGADIKVNHAAQNLFLSFRQFHEPSSFLSTRSL